MRVSKGLRKLGNKITQDCDKCKIKMKKVSEVKMSTHSEARTLLAPRMVQRKTIKRSKEGTESMLTCNFVSIIWSV